MADGAEDELYAARDWLVARQAGLEKRLAKRHLREGEGSLVLCELFSICFESSCCPLAARGHSRDGKSGALQVNHGLLTDARGCPAVVSVQQGTTADSVAFLPEVQRPRDFADTELDLEDHARSGRSCPALGFGTGQGRGEYAARRNACPQLRRNFLIYRGKAP